MLTVIGVVFLSALLLLAALFVGAQSVDREDPKAMQVVIDTSYVGQGVVAGAPVTWHGLDIGHVREVTSQPEGVSVTLTLDRESVSSLTDSLDIDFRPRNYFGITTINVIPGHGGEPLRDGARLALRPRGNYTMQALLAEVGSVSRGVLTTEMIDVLERITDYTDALNPLIETALVAANAVATVQTVPTSQLLANTAALSAGFPPFLEGMLTATDGFVNTGTQTASDEEFFEQAIPSLDTISGSLFGAVGHLLGSHRDELAPAADIATAVSDVVPKLIDAPAIGSMTRELRERLERAFADTPTIKVRLVLDSLPALAAPFAFPGLPR